MADKAEQSKTTTHNAGKESSMADTNRPAWIRDAHRVDRPDINRWFQPEDGPVDGTLIWRGKQEQRQTGDTYNVYAFREAVTGLIIGMWERAGLRDLRNVKIGSKVFVNPSRIKEFDDGRKVQQYEVFAEELEPQADPSKAGPGRGGGAPPASSDGVPF